MDAQTQAKFDELNNTMKAVAAGIEKVASLISEIPLSSIDLPAINVERLQGQAYPTVGDYAGVWARLMLPNEIANIHNVAATLNVNFLANSVFSSMPQTMFRIQIAMGGAGIFSAVISNGGNAQKVMFNGGAALVSGAIYLFDMLVHSGDTVNFQYSTSQTIQIFRVQEVKTGGQ